MSTAILKETAPRFPVLESPPEFKQLTSRQIANTHYGGRPVAEGSGYKIYTDEPVFTKDIEEIRLYNYRFAKTINGIDVVLFASKNGATLLQHFLAALPQSNELILFLEIDDEYNYNTILRAKIGAGLTDKNKMPFAEILNFSREHQVKIAPKDIKELVEKEIYRNKVSLISWFLGLKDALIAKIFDFFTEGIFEEAEAFFKSVATEISELKISETGWNPNPKEGEYDPALIPKVVYEEMKKYYEHSASKNLYENLEGQKKVNSKISDALFEKIDGAEKYFFNLLDNAGSIFPKFILDRLKDVLKLVFGQVGKIKKFLSDPLTGMQHAVYKSVQISNAFLCGIYNSLVDIVAGLFSLIGFIFRAVAEIGNFSKNKEVYGQLFLELIENLIEGVQKFNFADFFFQWINFQIKGMVKAVQWIAENVNIGLEKAAYYYGYIVGIIIDIIVETLLTGGTAAVAKLLEGAGSFLRNPLSKIEKGINAISEASKKMLDRAIDFFNFMVSRLKKGAKPLFDDLEKFLDEIFGFGEKVADNALTPAEKRWKEKQRKIQEKLERKKNKQNKVLDDLEGGISKKLYAIWKVNLKEGKYNCANTAIATDATLGGRQASALPYTIQKRFRNGKWEQYASFDEGTKSIVLEKEFGTKFSSWTTNLDDLIKDLKPNKRGIIFGVKKGKNMGHYFNVINEKGIVKFLDGQTGKKAKLVYDYYQFLPTN